MTIPKVADLIGGTARIPVSDPVYKQMLEYITGDRVKVEILRGFVPGRDFYGIQSSEFGCRHEDLHRAVTMFLCEFCAQMVDAMTTTEPSDRQAQLKARYTHVLDNYEELKWRWKL